MSRTPTERDLKDAPTLDDAIRLLADTGLTSLEAAGIAARVRGEGGWDLVEIDETTGEKTH